MTRVAYLSPLPPEASGIADYSAELLASLRHRLDLEVFSATSSCVPDSVGLAVRPYDRFLDAHKRRPYEAVLYHLGNNAAFHSDIYPLLLQVPGIVVLHEYMLHHLIRGMTNARDYVEAMRYSYGSEGEVVARRFLDLGGPSECWAFPLFERAVDASLGLIVHNETSRRRVLRSRPDARVAVVPLHLSLEGLPQVTETSRRALRRALGASDEGFLVASFGNINRAKRIDVTLRAFARLRQAHPDAVYVLAGEFPASMTEVRAMLEGELGEGVIVTGRLEFSRMLDLMAVADVAINLRHPQGGETSATCVRILGLGTPVIVSAGGWFSEIPDGCCAKVAVGRFEDEELLAVLEAMATQPDLRHDIGTAAARWARREHDLSRSVEGYVRCVEETIREAPRVYRPVPPLPPYGMADVSTALAADVGAAAADLGVGENDDALLPALAEALDEIGLVSVVTDRT